jgi:hypothetical protein
VNGWFGVHDKLSTTRQFLAECIGIDIERERTALAPEQAAALGCVGPVADVCSA